ncbi:MAG: hypothetical protein JXQ91_12450 [Vannielia sp.]|uniref:hypothetical protein n=1 Tax=Rhodobacterales TaxID=204455 RepID=UPI002095AE65|nr:hypothetical protein [Oceanicola sp. 502str15]MCO6383934.1 hypothetical protein [Oceanicola sp. 502str15]
MTNLAKSTIAAVLAGSLGTAAFAGSVGVDAEAGVSGAVSGATETAQSTANQVENAVTSTAQEVQDGATDMAENGASAKAKVNFGSVISGLNNGTTAQAAADIEALGADVSVDTVLLSEIEGAGNSNALDKALSTQADAMVSLHEAIEANSELTAALEAEGFEADDVVGFESEGEGEVTLVIDDRA